MRKYLLTLSLTMAASAVVAPAAQAQTMITYEMRHPNHNFSQEYDSKILLRPEVVAKQGAAAGMTAHCLVAKAKAKADAMVGGPLTADERYSRLMSALSGRYNSCVEPNAAGIPMMVINGFLAEELVENRHVSLADRVNVSDVAAATKFLAGNDDTALDVLGRCLAVYSPGMGMKVLATKPGSVEESATLANLLSQSPECGVAKAPVELPVSWQRSVVASGLYHWVSHS